MRLVGLEQLGASLSPIADARFPLRVPRGFIARMRHADANDPLLLQVLPRACEYDATPGFELDPVGDLDARSADGVLQKYAGRALLITTGACAVHCRYCFRRHFPYAEQTAAVGQWQPALARLLEDTSIREVILSGGDPLSLATTKLAALTDALTAISHVRRLRIHTRLPVVLPERVDRELLDWLAALPLQRVVVLHVNHANEIDGSVEQACQALRKTGVTLLNQSVLLRGINDEVRALADLSERLFACGVMPYYLHQLDRVRGSAHFEVADERASRLIGELRALLPGFLVPRLVREVAGANGKVPL